MELLKGVDVSAFQNKVDWKRVQTAGVAFAVLKVIRKDLKPDKEFENNWQGCLESGVPIQGVYNYSYATTVQKAIGDAQAVLHILGSERHPMVWLDWEDPSLPKGRQAADIINAYGDVITAGGCDMGLYFGMAYYDANLRDIMELVRPQYRKGWTARYYNGYREMDINDSVNEKKRPDNFAGALYGWQYTSRGRIDGITGFVDLDLWYVDTETADAEPEIRAAYSLSDFIRESRDIWGVTDTASAAEILRKTVTVNTTKNKSHEIVTLLERYMQSLGYYTGHIEADRGGTPVFGNGMKKAVILYQTHAVGAHKRHRDGELTAGGATWAKLYGA